MLDRLRGVPGVESAAFVSTLPLSGFDRRGFHIQDRPVANESDVPYADTYSISPNYFRAMRIPLKRGRTFTEADRAGTPKVAIVSESCARSQFPGRDALGQHIQVGGRDDKREWLTIVGIAGDVRQYGLDQPPNMEVYLAQAQDVRFGYNLAVRTAGDPRSVEKSVQDAVLSADATQPVYRVKPLEDYMSHTLAARTFTLALLGLFGLVALALAAVGVYGVISYTVSQRTREVGIRMALGADRSMVLAMVLRQGLTLIACGTALGVCASAVLTRFLLSLLYEVRPTDLTSAVATSVGLAAVALLAAYLPARRATRIDPISALRVG